MLHSYCFLFKHKTAYEMRISDWSSGVCSSDLGMYPISERLDVDKPARPDSLYGLSKCFGEDLARYYWDKFGIESVCLRIGSTRPMPNESRELARSEEHTSELQSLMRISYAVFCLKKKKQHK